VNVWVVWPGRLRLGPTSDSRQHWEAARAGYAERRKLCSCRQRASGDTQ
jgi:hypothetical protein